MWTVNTLKCRMALWLFVKATLTTGRCRVNCWSLASNGVTLWFVLRKTCVVQRIQVDPEVKAIIRERVDQFYFKVYMQKYLSVSKRSYWSMQDNSGGGLCMKKNEITCNKLLLLWEAGVNKIVCISPEFGKCIGFTIVLLYYITYSPAICVINYFMLCLILNALGHHNIQGVYFMHHCWKDVL